jgi:hypothetical protein
VSSFVNALDEVIAKQFWQFAAQSQESTPSSSSSSIATSGAAASSLMHFLSCVFFYTFLPFCRSSSTVRLNECATF